MTKSFDEYLKEDKSNVYPSARQAYKAGQQSKQAEVDELQKRIDEALKSSKEFYDFGDMWLASANREGYKLVPVDSLKEIIDCAYCHIYDRCIGDEGDDVIKHILAMGVEDDH